MYEKDPHLGYGFQRISAIAPKTTSTPFLCSADSPPDDLSKHFRIVPLELNCCVFASIGRLPDKAFINLASNEDNRMKFNISSFELALQLSRGLQKTS